MPARITIAKKALKVTSHRVARKSPGTEQSKEIGGDGFDDARASDYPVERVEAVYRVYMNAIRPQDE